MDIDKERTRSTSHQDLLQAILEGSMNGELGTLIEGELIVDNCKNIFLGGYLPPALAAIWGLMLLASHPEWQDHAHSEVLELKMVIQEVLRLYPGVTLATREAMQDVKRGDLQVPKGVGIWIWLLSLHRDPELWGPDADMFSPERFINGVTGACKSSQAYIPFWLGSSSVSWTKFGFDRIEGVLCCHTLQFQAYNLSKLPTLAYLWFAFGA
ncbi:hypothetical protein GH714_012049 [Hevea brasiliensis]|uniref:Cytochrome P450 n=1 Tax=Hevea brasiliensis TaxID=3981 RepID=A0A6A6LFV1_HEVBR|nr:hypothetical protein GH714_012049 [Hevea brasiliensis]